jgi:glycine cleavage system aminomethyltransferase T
LTKASLVCKLLPELFYEIGPRTNWLDAVAHEYKLVTSKVGLIDLTPFAKFVVKGEYQLHSSRKYLGKFSPESRSLSSGA